MESDVNRLLPLRLVNAAVLEDTFDVIGHLDHGIWVLRGPAAERFRHRDGRGQVTTEEEVTQSASEKREVFRLRVRSLEGQFRRLGKSIEPLQRDPVVA